MPFNYQRGEEPQHLSEVVAPTPPAHAPPAEAGTTQAKTQRPLAAGGAAPRAAAPEPPRVAPSPATHVRPQEAGRIPATAAPVRARVAATSSVRRDPGPDSILRERWALSGGADYVARFAPSGQPVPPVRSATGGTLRDERGRPTGGPGTTARRRSQRASRGRTTMAFAAVALALAFAAAWRWAGWPARAASAASPAAVAATDGARPASETVPPALAAGCPSGASSAATSATADASEDFPPTAAGSQTAVVVAPRVQTRQAAQTRPRRSAATSDAISATIHAAQSKADAFLRGDSGAPAGR
ncbi:MAG TPA: hypothetical protein VES00_17600 [Burkholderiaceae bacterium]|nr:hypothetical protein [Burkholderiaceae bacterium]